MATVDLISYRVRDNAGKTGNILIYVPSGSTIANLQSFSDSLVALLDDTTGGLFESVSVSKALTLPGGLKVAPVAGHFVNLGANLAFDADQTIYNHTIRIPAILESLVVGEDVDISDPLITALETGIVTGFGGPVASDKYANDLTALLSGKATFWK